MCNCNDCGKIVYRYQLCACDAQAAADMIAAEMGIPTKKLTDSQLDDIQSYMKHAPGLNDVLTDAVRETFPGDEDADEEEIFIDDGGE